MSGTPNPRTRILTLLGVGGLVLVGATACNINIGIGEEGSGSPQTITYDLGSFDEVDISSAFTAEITVVDGPPLVEVTVDDNRVEQLEVAVDNGELKIAVRGSSINFGVAPTVVISLPALTELDLNGASSATVTGVAGSKLELNFSGASDAHIDGAVATLVINGNGASAVEFAGSADEVTLDLSGASSADLTNSTVGSATVDLSGGSDASFATVDEVVGDLSGAASVSVPNGTSVAVNTSGGASVHRN